MVGPDAAESIKIITRAASERIARFAFEYAVAQRPAQGHGRPQGQHHEALRRPVPRVAAGRSRPTTRAGSSSRTASSTTCACSWSRSRSCTTCSCCPTCTATSSATCARASSAAWASRPAPTSATEAAVFEPVHGSAPKYAGQDRANPTALILSGVLMLRHLGEQAAAERVETAVRDVIAEGRDTHLRPRRRDRHAATSPTRSSSGSARPPPRRPDGAGAGDARLRSDAAVPGQRGDARVGVPPHLGRRDLGVHPAPRRSTSASPARTRRCTTTCCRSTRARSGGVLEVLLGAALLYHALNGLRIIIMDFWPAMTRYHRQLWYACWVIFVIVGIPVGDPDHGAGLRVRAAVHVQGLTDGTRDPRPDSAQAPGRRLASWRIWYRMRLTGLGLFVLALAHYMHPALPLRTRPTQNAAVDRRRALGQHRLADLRLADARRSCSSTRSWACGRWSATTSSGGVADGDHDGRSTCSAHRPVRRWARSSLVTLPLTAARAA